ncbi:hypothetical protein Droror1_Dr00016227 [Drosera rotundifolia]
MLGVRPCDLDFGFKESNWIKLCEVAKAWSPVSCCLDCPDLDSKGVECKSLCLSIWIDSVLVVKKQRAEAYVLNCWPDCGSWLRFWFDKNGTAYIFWSMGITHFLLGLSPSTFTVAISSCRTLQTVGMLSKLQAPAN